MSEIRNISVFHDYQCENCSGIGHDLFCSKDMLSIKCKRCNRTTYFGIPEVERKQGVIDCLKELDKVDKRLLATADFLKNKIKELGE